jgi:hypothetical protein
LEERHRRGLRTVLIIDEAHELSDFVLEEIRLLLNFESDNAKHLQIVLTGQPELREKLNQANLRQLKQRVALRCKMHQLPNVDETERYITERLLIAGSDQPNMFTPGAIDFIFQCSEGIPRQINNICDNALLAGYAAGEQIIGRQIIEEVADNLDLLPRNENLMAHEKTVENVGSARVLTAEAREELWNNRSRVESTSNHATSSNHTTNSTGSTNSNNVKMFQTNPQNSNGNGSVKQNPFDDLDDEVNLEIEEVGGFY